MRLLISFLVKLTLFNTSQAIEFFALHTTSPENMLFGDLSFAN